MHVPKWFPVYTDHKKWSTNATRTINGRETNLVLEVGPDDAVDVGSRRSVESQDFLGRDPLWGEVISPGLEPGLEVRVEDDVDARDLELVGSYHVLEKKVDGPGSAGL